MVRPTASLAALAVFVLLDGAAAPPRAAGSASPAVAALADTLSFEFADSTGAPAGWFAWKRSAVVDTVDAHHGRAAARIDRDAKSVGEFSAFNRTVPVDFRGDTLELRGWLRTENVSRYAGLWVREDDGADQMLLLDNMDGRGPGGTTPWAEYRAALPLDPRARRIVIGGLIVGTGRVWVDGLRLLVDGRPIADAPRLVRKPPPAEKDHEFDAGSRVGASDLSATPVENLVLLAKVWGFLKYHHPGVAEGKRHWDYELFRVLPKVAKARTRPEASRAIARWVDRVGMPPPCRPCAAAPDSAVLPAPIAWIRDGESIGRDLSARLERVHRDRYAALDHYYIGPAHDPNFANEPSYEQAPYPDAGYRLLALFRFWNLAEYWFPYRDLLKEDWETVLREFIPRALRAKDRDEYRLAMIDLVARVHDGHANVWNALDARPPRGPCRLPAALRPVGDRFVVGALDSSRAATGGLRIGDVVLALDGAPVDSLVRAWAPHYGASNEAARRRDIGRFLTRGPCGPCRATLDRGRGPEEIIVPRDSSALMEGRAGLDHDLSGSTFRKLADDVAYLKLSSVVAADAKSYVERAAGTRCFVIDIRNYPKESVVYALGRHLVARPTAFARFSRGDQANPGAFVWTQPLVIEPAAPRYEGKVVVLVDEVSQSHAEFTAMAFRAAGALIVGSTTAGADGNMYRFPLPGGLRAAFSGLGAYYPDGRPTQRIGIVPDLVVHPTVEGIRAGKDEVLEAALEAVLGRAVQFTPGP